MQRMFFCHYLTQIGLVQQCKTISSARIERMAMPWRTTTNAKDCGVFLMRHMETYKGERVEYWNCGLKKTSKGVLQSLRAKYCSALMNAIISHECIHNKLITSRYYVEASKNNHIDVENMIAEYLKKK